MKLSQIGLKYVDVTVAATLANGTPATLAGVDLTVVPPGSSPDQHTVWTASSYNSTTKVATILVAGPNYATPPAGSLVAPVTGGDLWARVTDTPEVDAALVDRIALF